MNDTDDDLARWLAPPPPVPENPDTREALMDHARRAIQRQLWLRRSVRVCAGVLLLAVGGSLGWFLKPTPAPTVVKEIVYVPQAVPPPPAPPEPSPTPAPTLSARQLELKAEMSDDREEVAKLYREAGDKYLKDEREPGEAARCYRLHLQHAGTPALTVNTADSWLLIEMKTIQTQEKENAKSDS
jgi:hypothetical protein